MSNTTKTIQETFEEKFEKSADESCWNWTGDKTQDGYGRFQFNGKRHRAHRFSYQLYVGEIFNNLLVLHKCDNPSCVNPSHLFLGTDADNAHDRVFKGRGAHLSGGKNGMAKLTVEQVETIRSMRNDGVKVVDLMKLYHVSQQHISRIITHRAWMVKQT